MSKLIFVLVLVFTNDLAGATVILTVSFWEYYSNVFIWS